MVLSAFYRPHHQQSLDVLGFSLDGPDALPAVRQVAAKFDFRVGLPGSAYAGAHARIWRIPVNFTIHRHGVLADDGWNDEHPARTRERLQRIVAPLLAA